VTDSGTAFMTVADVVQESWNMEGLIPMVVNCSIGIHSSRMVSYGGAFPPVPQSES
jgi:hypothetical protein